MISLPFFIECHDSTDLGLTGRNFCFSGCFCNPAHRSGESSPFIGGVIIGALSLLGVIFRQRREISRLKREAVKKPTSATPEVPPTA